MGTTMVHWPLSRHLHYTTPCMPHKPLPQHFCHTQPSLPLQPSSPMSLATAIHLISHRFSIALPTSKGFFLMMLISFSLKGMWGWFGSIVCSSNEWGRGRGKGKFVYWFKLGHVGLDLLLLELGVNDCGVCHGTKVAR